MIWYFFIRLDVCIHIFSMLAWSFGPQQLSVKEGQIRFFDDNPVESPYKEYARIALKLHLSWISETTLYEAKSRTFMADSSLSTN